MPFGLDLFNWTNEFFKCLKTAAALQQFGGICAMSLALEDEMREGPPVEIVEIEVAVHAGAAAIGDDGAEGDDGAVRKIFREVGAGGEFVDPPDGIGVAVNFPDRKFSRVKLASAEIFGQTFA